MIDNCILSIIIPVYNVESFISTCLDSAVALKDKSIEIIIVDDGSTDSSGIICKEYESQYPFIHYYYQSNGGLSAARNTGIRNSKGKYLLFLDSDDYLKIDNLEKLYNDIKESEEDIIFGRAFECDKGTEILSQIDYSLLTSTKYPSKVFQQLEEHNSFWFAAWLVIPNRSFIIENNLFFHERIYHEDELWVPAVFVSAQSVRMINYGFYCYRTNREGSIINVRNIKKEFDKFVIIDELCRLQTQNKSGIEVIQSRIAALVFGLVLKLHTYNQDTNYHELKRLINNYLDYLNYGKYRIVFLLTKAFGLENTSKILSLISN